MGSRVVIRGDRGQYEILLDGKQVGSITTGTIYGTSHIGGYSVPRYYAETEHGDWRDTRFKRLRERIQRNLEKVSPTTLSAEP